jgi:DHA1 family multidrug resistance protein-like MFS transporter
MFRNAKLLTLFFTMLVIMIGFGIIIPIMPFYVEHFGAGGSEMGLMFAVFSIMQFLSSPFWGNLSDRYGRRRILMIGVLGNAASLVVIGLANSFWVMFASRAVEGLLSSATLPTAMAYISDSTSEDERGGGMGLIGAAMGVGMILGPGIGGWLAGDSLSRPFFLAAGMSLLSLLMIVLVLPESLPQEKRSGAHSPATGPDQTSTNPHQAGPRRPQLVVMWQALLGPLGFLLFLAFMVNFALANFEGIFGLYADQRLGYGPQQVGSILMVIGVISSVVQLLLTGPATRRLGEPLTIQLSLIASAFGFLLMALVTRDALVVLTVGFFVFANAMLRPAIMSLTSKLARGGQGMALGLNNAFQSLGRVVGPLWAGLTFDYNLLLPYLSAAVILTGTFIYALYAMQPARLRLKFAPAPAVQAGDEP